MLKKTGIALALGMAATLLASAFSSTASAKQVIVQNLERSTDSLTIEIRRPELRCDGVDSSLVILTRRHQDGSIAAGASISIYMSPGSYSVAKGPGDSSGQYQFDEKGELRLRVYPTDTGHGYWVIQFATALGQRSGFHYLSCPFTDDRTYTVSGEVWNDRDSDGQRDVRERNLSGFGIKVRCAICFYFGGVPWHFQRTDALGRYEWTGLVQGGAGSYGRWELCLDDKYAARWSIVSVNGSPTASNACVEFHTVDPGNQTFSLGVARR